jgi:prepilin-type N-terminal cleavage/methylation domain-containing protein
MIDKLNITDSNKDYNETKNEEGFTLVEMLVSVSLFAIVLVVILGSILTIIDVNRKSQSLTTVMNDLNFSLESLTRTIKTGSLSDVNDESAVYDALTITNQDDVEVTYSFEETDIDGETRGRIDRVVDGDTAISITSDEVDIDVAEFTVFNDDDDNKQTRVLILLKGVVRVSPRISSEFFIQTTVSQRNIDAVDIN